MLSEKLNALTHNYTCIMGFQHWFIHLTGQLFNWMFQEQNPGQETEVGQEAEKGGEAPSKVEPVVPKAEGRSHTSLIPSSVLR